MMLDAFRLRLLNLVKVSLLSICFLCALNCCSKHDNQYHDSQTYHHHRVLDFNVYPVENITLGELKRLCAGLSRRGFLHKLANGYYYIPVSQGYIDNLYPVLKKRESRSWDSCLHTPYSLDGRAHITVKVVAVDDKDYDLMQYILQRKVPIEFSLGATSPPVNKALVTKLEDGVKYKKTWYSVAVKLSFPHAFTQALSPAEHKMLRKLLSRDFHISIAAQKRAKGECVCTRSFGRCIGA
jgi:hypothetical protein